MVIDLLKDEVDKLFNFRGQLHIIVSLKKTTNKKEWRVVRKYYGEKRGNNDELFYSHKHK